MNVLFGTACFIFGWVVASLQHILSDWEEMEEALNQDTANRVEAAYPVWVRPYLSDDSAIFKQQVLGEFGPNPVQDRLIRKECGCPPDVTCRRCDPEYPGGLHE